MFVFFCVADIKGLKVNITNTPTKKDDKKIGILICIRDSPLVRIISNSLFLLTLIVHNIPPNKKAKGNISISILGKFRDPNRSKSLTLLSEYPDNFFAYSTISPIKTTEEIDKEVIKHENKKLKNINLKNSELIFILLKLQGVDKLFSYSISKIGIAIKNPNIE